MDNYIFDCVGNCGYKTNGSQYCCKTYCMFEQEQDKTDSKSESKSENKRTMVTRSMTKKLLEKDL